jgi:hypothetical protein
MTRTSRVAMGLMVALPLAWRPATCQSVRGEVLSATTLTPLPFSRVVLEPGFDPRLTDATGRFAITNVQPGSYRLTLKHIGYMPFDTVLTVTSGLDIVIRAALSMLAVELPAVTVVAGRTCTQPGPPDPKTAPELAAIFTELRENAGFYRLHADAYPFRYWVQRRYQPSPLRTFIDTVEYRSVNRWRYTPGRMIRKAGAPSGRTERSLILPNIADLADEAFHGAHCFTFGGVERIGERPHLRVDFQAAARLRSPDVDGSAWLDSVTYALGRFVLQLTRPEEAERNIAAVEVTVLFGEVQPSLHLPQHILSVTTFTGNRPSGFEEQRFVRLEYLRGGPGRP